MEYIIVGDTKNYEGCLICTCGNNKEFAEKVLVELRNPTNEMDKKRVEGHFNLRIEEVNSNECWWNDPFLAN